MHGLNLIFRKRVVRITVQPALARLRRRDDGMSGRVRVFSGVPIWRAVAAERDAAFLAGPEMHPVCADLHAFFAFAALRLFDQCDCVEMSASLVRHYSVSLFRVMGTRNALVTGGLRDVWFFRLGQWYGRRCLM